MEKITEKRKKIEIDLIKVLRDFDDQELYEIIIKYAKITKDKKQKEADQAAFEEKRLIKSMMEKEIAYHMELLETFKKADDARKKEIYCEEKQYFSKIHRIYDRHYLYEIVKTLAPYAISIGDVDSADRILRHVDYCKKDHWGFISAWPADEGCVLQDVVLDLLKKDIDLGKEDLVQKHMETALRGYYGALHVRDGEGYKQGFREKEYKEFCDKYRIHKMEAKQKKVEEGRI